MNVAGSWVFDETDGHQDQRLEGDHPDGSQRQYDSITEHARTDIKVKHRFRTIERDVSTSVDGRRFASRAAASDYAAVWRGEHQDEPLEAYRLCLEGFSQLFLLCNVILLSNVSRYIYVGVYRHEMRYFCRFPQLDPA